MLIKPKSNQCCAHEHYDSKAKCSKILFHHHLQTPIYHQGVPKKAIYFGCIQEEIFNSSQQNYIFKYFQNSGSIAYLRFITSTHTFKENLSDTELRYKMQFKILQRYISWQKIPTFKSCRFFTQPCKFILYLNSVTDKFSLKVCVDVMNLK